MIIKQGFPSTSASKTDIFLCQENHKQYILKLFIDRYKVKDQYVTPSVMFKHEIEIYRYLTTHLYENKEVQVRNLIPIYKVIHFTFPELVHQLSIDFPSLHPNQILRNILASMLYMFRQTKKRHKINRSTTSRQTLRSQEIQYFEDHQIDLFKTCFTGMMTPKINQLTFVEYINRLKNSLSITHFMNYVFIILVTQLSMASVGINQNDLHWGNILMDKSYRKSASQTNGYLLLYDQHILFIENEYTPYLFDFDRATKQGEIMSFLQKYRKGGNCPTFHNKRDLLKTLCILFHSCRSINRPEFLTVADHILHQCISSTTLRTHILQSSMNCWLTTEDGHNSILCSDHELNTGMCSWKQSMNYILSMTNYLKVHYRTITQTPTQTLLQPHSTVLQPALFSLLSRIHQQVTTNHLSIVPYLEHNVQYFGCFSSPLRDNRHLRYTLLSHLRSQYQEVFYPSIDQTIFN